MATQVQVAETLYCKETILDADDTHPSTDVVHEIPTGVVNYNATTHPGLETWSETVTLVAGAATLDLTALTRTALATINMNGLRLLAVKMAALATNTQPVTMVPGASNGYTALGLGIRVGVSAGAAADPATDVPDEVLIHLPSATAVDGTHKTLDLASSHLTASVAIIITART